jgi:uncharacterized Rmd1/YagE family protein
MNRCTCTCLAKRLALDELQQRFAARLPVTLYRDALHVESVGQVFLFDYGVMVTWGLGEDEDRALRDVAEEHCREPLEPPVVDAFTFETDASDNRIHADHISLAGQDPLSLLAVSHAMAQSSKLAVFEDYALQAIEETSAIPRGLVKDGRIRLSRREISCMRGRLFLVESDINLHYGLLDTPEFFWEYPALEGLYGMTARYLDVQSRTKVLNRKLGIIQELFAMLADEQKHKHSSLLEWIIIWLIAIEIVIFLGYELSNSL